MGAVRYSQRPLKTNLPPDRPDPSFPESEVGTAFEIYGTAAEAFSLDPSLGAMLQVAFAVKDSRAEICRLGYQVSLYGRLVEGHRLPHPPVFE